VIYTGADVRKKSYLSPMRLSEEGVPLAMETGTVKLLKALTNMSRMVMPAFVDVWKYI